MKRLGWSLPALALFMALGGFATTAATAMEPAEFMNTLVGSWRGTGFLVKRNTGEEQTAVCNLKTASTAEGIANSGRCAANSAGGNVEGSLRYDAERQVFVGSFIDPEAKVSKPANGTLDDNTLTMVRTETRGSRDVQITAVVRMESADRYRVDVSEQIGAKSTMLLRLTFVRRS